MWRRRPSGTATLLKATAACGRRGPLDVYGTSAKVKFHDAAPLGLRASADQAVTTDLASVSPLASELRAALIEKGLIKD